MNTPQETMNFIPAMMYSWQMDNGESTFLHVSDYCQELLGVSAKEALQDADSIMSQMLQEDAQSFSAATMASMRDLALFDCQVRMRRPMDGAVITVRFKSRPRRQGAKTIWDGVAMEVASSDSAAPTNDAATEETMRSPQHEEEPKEAAVQSLVAAERNLTEWLSHEIRNPLSVTMEALQALQELHVNCSHEQDNYSAAECYQVMTESIRYVEDLLNNMKDLDQCDQGQMPVVSTPCTVREDILLPTYRMMKRLVPQDGPVHLRMAPGASVIGVVAHVDKLRLRQVLTNLIANSFHFTSQGFVEVDMRIQAQRGQDSSAHDAPQQMLAFHIRDSGCGVAPSLYDTLFSRWELLGSSRNGTGIGLCLCQALVKAMGGSIRLNTDYHSGVPGHPGAEFVVIVPIESAKEVSQIETEATPETQRMPDVSLSSALFTQRKVSLKDPLQPDLQRPPTLSMSTLTTPAPSYYSHPSFGSDNVEPNTPPQAVQLEPRFPRRSSMPVTAGDATSSSSSSPATHRTVSFFKGRYRFLIVDDEKMGRKFLNRRFTRLFPEATVTEVASGEEALVKAASIQYDIITMDHFMAIDELNGDETIQKLRSQLKSDSLIVGISGNEKQAEHLQAGADAFFQKPLPKDGKLIELLQNQLAPPAAWKVLILSDDAEAASVITERLHQAASPHFTTQEQAKKRWNIETRSLASAEAVIEHLTAESIDLVILADANPLFETAGASIRKHLRHMAERENVLVVECSDSDKPETDASSGKDVIPFASTWSLKDLPSSKSMRQSLSKSLLSVRTVSSKSSSAPPCSPVLATKLPPKRSNSGTAKSA